MPTAHFIRHVTSLSTNTIGTDALNALLRITGVTDPEVVEESDTHVIISYKWGSNAVPPDDPESHFRVFGLQKISGAA